MEFIYKPFALLTRYLGPLRVQVSGLSGLLFAGIALELINPQVIRYFIDSALANSAQRNLLWAALVFTAISLLQRGVALIATYTTENISWTATNRLRTDLTLHCLSLDMGFHKKHTPGELIERIDGDVTSLANFFSQFVIRVLGNGLLVLGILILLFRENIWVGLGLGIYCLFVLLVLRAIQPIAVPRWKQARQAAADQYGFIAERISGVEDIRSASAEEHMIYRLLLLMRTFLEKYRSAFLIGNLMQNMTNLFFSIGYAFGLALGVYLYTHGQASIGTAYLIVNYVGMLSSPLQDLRGQFQDFQQASASIQRIQELFHLQPIVKDRHSLSGDGYRPLQKGAMEVEFQDVSFSYEGNGDVLKNLSLRLGAGRVLGVLGRTGSGKTTITRLLFRLYDPTRGTIRLGTQDIRDVSLTDLHTRIGMVTQDVQLFQASIRDNLTFFNHEIREDKIILALRELRLIDWLDSLPQGLDSLLLAGGQGLSAGQAQLLAFTRVFLKDPGLVILDEASSRLDPATEMLMEQAISRLFAGRTGILIAHRLQTILRADDILILEDGCVVEYGGRQVLASDPESRFSCLLKTGLEEALA